MKRSCNFTRQNPSTSTSIRFVCICGNKQASTLCCRRAFWSGSNGEELPRVTDILAAAGLLPDYGRWDPKHKGIAKGTAVDYGCQLLFKGYKLEDLDVDPRILPELQSLDLWIKATGFMAVAVQQEVRSKLGYVGHVDVLSVDTVVDSKSGEPAPWHRAQTAAYFLALNEDDENWMQHRGSLYLRKNGEIAKYKHHDDRADFGVFLSALKLYQGEKALEPYRENIKRWLEAS